jgi:2'-5' RNA ligase
MRLFTGIAPTPEVVSNVVTRMESIFSRVRGVPKENLHITTKFIGQWPDARVAELQDALSKLQPPHAFRIRIAGLGLFPGTLYAQVLAGPELRDLASGIDTALEPLGCARENRPFTPHLTLARLKHENIGELRQMITNMADTDFGSFEATEFHLYLSKPVPRGSVYSKLSTWRLA